MKTPTITLLLLSALQPSAFAASNTLQAIVRPGYVYGANERPTTSTLNRLGNPTVEVTGTIDGTSGLAAGTVTGTILSDSLPGTNMTYDGSSPRKLVIKNAGVGSNQLDSAVAGFGLAGGGGAYFKVNIDSNSIISTADGDGIRVSTNLSPGVLAWTSNSIIGAITYWTNAFGTNVFGGTNNIATNGPIALPVGLSLSGTSLVSTAVGGIAAWAKFSGTATGTNAPTAGMNVSNVIRSSVGHYTVNFTNAMASTNYGIQITTTGTYLTPEIGNQLTNSFDLITIRDVGSPPGNDPAFVHITVIQ